MFVLRKWLKFQCFLVKATYIYDYTTLLYELAGKGLAGEGGLSFRPVVNTSII